MAAQPGPSDARVVEAVAGLAADALAATRRRPVVIGLCGAQGSGKTTLAQAVLAACRDAGLRCAALSIDDLYLTRAERRALASDVHPLFATRGVPATHDVALGLAVLAKLERGETVALPRFDKAIDDRAPRDSWPNAPTDCEVVLLEGWCVGAMAQDDAALRDPVNALERDEDPDAVWRTYANAALRSAYPPLFARIDRLALLAAPGFDVVHGWRLQQEEELTAAAGHDARTMDAAAIGRFIGHYERLTRHILSEMPGRADLVVRLDEQRRLVAITWRR